MSTAAREAVSGGSWEEATRVLRGYYEAVLAGQPRGEDSRTLRPWADRDQEQANAVGQIGAGELVAEAAEG